jgi:hypothetical protein
MNELLDSLRTFTSRNEFFNQVEMTHDAYDELQSLAEEYDGVYVDKIGEDRDRVDVEITLDLDTIC